MHFEFVVCNWISFINGLSLRDFLAVKEAQHNSQLVLFK